MLPSASPTKRERSIANLVLTLAKQVEWSCSASHQPIVAPQPARSGADVFADEVATAIVAAELELGVEP